MESSRQEYLVRGLIHRGQRPAGAVTTEGFTAAGRAHCPCSQTATVATAELEPISSKFAYDKQAYAALSLHEQRWITAVAVGKSMRKAALAGRAAARVHGMWVIGPPSDEAELVEVMAVGGKVPSKSQWPKGCIYIGQRARTATIVEFTTLRATDPLSTAFEIALRHGFREGLVAMDWILANHAPRNVVEAEVQRLGAATGIATLRRVVRYAVDNSMSPYESYARAMLIDAGLTGWEVNAEVAGYFIDLRRGWFGLEIDGRTKYDGETYRPVEETILRERAREKQLQNCGMVIGRVTPTQLMTDEAGFLTMVRQLTAIADRLSAPG